MTEVGDVIGGVTIITEAGRPKDGDEEAVGPTYRALGYSTLAVLVSCMLCVQGAVADSLHVILNVQLIVIALSPWRGALPNFGAGNIPHGHSA